MKPVDLRNAQWHEVLTHVTEDMLRVHGAYLRHGPGTTREVAQRAGVSLLTLRPRTTDLHKLGLVQLVGQQGNEGVYGYVSSTDALNSGAWKERADFRKPAAPKGPEPQRVGFVTVDEAVGSLSPQEKAALGAKLLSQFGHYLKRRESGGSNQLSLAV